MIAVVPAAGRGTRLGSLTAEIPKALVPVAGRPVLGWVLDGLALADVTRAVVVIGHLGEQVEAWVRRESPLPVSTVRQLEPLGTADALLAAAGLVGSLPFMYAWGDLVTSAESYVNVLCAWDGAAVIGVNRVPDPAAGAAVEVDSDWRVKSIIEKPPPGTSSTPFNHAGLGVLPQEAWHHLEAVLPSARGELELTSALESLLSDRSMAAVEIGPVFDIGTPAGLAAAEQWATRA
jgi:UDP-N-acetylglucosamine diphosphorylase / glucose-1-phosphate thymidylyltransferase / UDP-N-acetylgalactosamine diphosphorylase / glucosamine-1-phosphate N-acetyltransferase / galactosamine-1-phosphate N-acetyltransferase